MDEISQVSPEVLARAMEPRLEFGRGLLAEASQTWGEYLLLTMPEVWEGARSLVRAAPAHIHWVTSMDHEHVRETERRLPDAQTVVGIGGGMVMDMAKYVGWQRGLDPILAPSIASVDACVTNTVAVRDAGRVRYIGFAIPGAVLSDYDLMQGAPAHLNRAGIGDILSIHTGLWDWRMAAERGRIAFDEAVARGVADLVDALEEKAEEIRQVSEAGLRWLIEAYTAENALCLQVGHSRPEEGSEHYFAYNIEHRTGKHFVHGELVCLGILLMSRCQQNEVERVERILARSGVRYQPADLDLSREEVESALQTLPAYVEQERLPYSVVNEVLPDSALVARICEDLVF